MREVVLRSGSNLIGRGSQCDLRVEHPSISEKHCELICSDGSVRVRDLNSTGGTTVNGRRIDAETLEPGAMLRVGEVDAALLIEVPAYSTEPAPGMEEDLHKIVPVEPVRVNSPRFWQSFVFRVIAVLACVVGAIYIARWLSGGP